MEDKQSQVVGDSMPDVTAQPAPVPTVLPEAVPDASATEVEQNGPEQITWTASEFIEHTKSLGWYASLGVAALLSDAVLYFFFRDKITSVVILVAAVTLGVYANRKPRQLEYKVDAHGLGIADRALPYNLFRSFAIVDEDAFSSIVFLPHKRFGLLTTIYFAPEDEGRIVDTISQHLPLEPGHQDALDKLMRRIRF